MKLTDEQRRIVEHEAVDGSIVLINAFAGSGKSLTMRNVVLHSRNQQLTGESEHYKRLAGKKYLYLVFNRDAEIAAKQDFYQKDDNGSFVDVRTHHSLALKFFIQTLRDRIDDDTKTVSKRLRKALRKIDKKIEQLRMANVVADLLPSYATTACEEDSSQDDDDSDDDDDDVMANLAHVDEFATMAGGDDATMDNENDPNALPIDLECDQFHPFGLTRGDPALVVLQNYFRDTTTTNIDGPLVRHADCLFSNEALRLPATIATQLQIVKRARRVWQQSVSGRVNPRTGNLTVSHDVTLKLFCAWKENSMHFIAQDYHTLLFDEAQDIDQILMQWIAEAKNMACYLVGDAFQSIYRFKGAVNAMEHLNQTADAQLRHRMVQYYLSCSFRFGDAVAQVANELLSRSGRFESMRCTHRLRALQEKESHIAAVHLPRGCTAKRQKSCDKLSDERVTAFYVNSLLSEDPQKEIMIVARKNNSLLTLAIELTFCNVYVTLSEKLCNRLKVGYAALQHYQSLEHVDGRVDYLFRCVRNAQRGKGKTLDFLTVNGDAARQPQQDGTAVPWVQFVKPLDKSKPTFASTTSNVCEQVMCELHILQLALTICDLNKTKTALAALLSKQDESDRAGANVLLSTVHACKGGEWDNVVMLNDFPDVSTLLTVLSWCRVRAFGDGDLRSKTQRKLFETKLKEVILTKVPDSADRQAAFHHLMRSAADVDNVDDFVGQIEEEIHLQYVAATRAKHTLHINYALQRFRATAN